MTLLLMRHVHVHAKPCRATARLRLVIPRAVHQMRLIKAVHERQYDQHLGAPRTYAELRKDFYWKGMLKQIAKVISQAKESSREAREEPSALGSRGSFLPPSHSFSFVFLFTSHRISCTSHTPRCRTGGMASPTLEGCLRVGRRSPPTECRRASRSTPQEQSTQSKASRYAH